MKNSSNVFHILQTALQCITITDAPRPNYGTAPALHSERGGERDSSPIPTLPT